MVNPMVAPQVQQAARALNDAGLLHQLVTTIRYDPKSTWQRAAKALFGIVGYDFDRQLRRRTLTEVPESVVATIPWGELVRLATAKADKSGIAGDFVWERAEKWFCRAAARRVRPPVTAVYSYEYCALPVFTAARSRGMATIYETPAAEPRFVFDCIQREIARYPELGTGFRRYEARHEERRIAWRRAEWASADLVIANSNFTRSTYAAAGLDTSKVRVVPLGAPPAVTPEQAARGGSDPSGPLRFIWAGKFGLMKGGHYLLQAWAKADLGRRAQLDVYGMQGLPESMLVNLPAGVVFHGSVPRAELMEKFAQADALVFPTLSDGFGMVATEAWAQGLPVITTRNAGAADMLRPGENGLLTDAADAGALAETLLWCTDHRPQLKAMRPASRETAAAWQWPDYHRSLVAALAPVIPSSA
jgi:glycosyltransferase involved in cell wall biosynthesis